MSSITAGTTSTTTLIHSGDTTGSLVFKTNDTGSGGTTAVTIDTSQRAAFVAGTAALPAITTSGDTNTGIFFPSADTIAFAEGGTEAMRIDSSGNVMVGATSSNYRLRVQGAVTDVGEGDTNVLQGLVSTTAQAAGVGPSLSFVATYDGGSGLAGMGSIAGIKENSTSGNYAGALKFMTRPNGGNLTERMRIDSSGNLLVGTTSTLGGKLSVKTSGSTNAYFTNDVAGGYILEADAASNGGTYYFINFRKTGTGISNITSNGTTVAYNTGSDYRLKQNIQPITNALSKVLQLKPCKWDWKEFWGNGSSQGFVAHELAEIVPECVTGEKDAVDADGNPVYQGIDTSFLVATLTAALQETKALIDTQAETINALTARIVALEEK